MANLPVANAPVSYGAFELTIGIDPAAPDALTVLDLVAEAGYQGIDAGPVGFLGRREELAERLASRKLAICGGYIELPFHQPERMGPALEELDALLDVFDAALPVNRSLGLPTPKPTLAAVGTEQKHALPGRAVHDPGIGLGAEAWKRLAISLEATVARCRERGFEPTLHNETGTSVEAPWEIEKALELTTIDLCLDTGHLLLGGGDPVESLRAWHSRVNHLHAKSARLDVMSRIIADQGPTEEIWRREAFCPLGQGDLDGDGLLALMRQLDWSGWIVVEQDTLPGPGKLERAHRNQCANRQYLRDRGV
jgi:inosose dehydratase